MTTLTMRIWTGEEWTDPEVVSEATCMQVLQGCKLFPEEEMRRLKNGNVVNCGLLTFRGNRATVTCDCFASQEWE